MAVYYKVDGSIVEVLPKNGRTFAYEELQEFIVSEGFEEERMVEIVPLPSGRSIVVNENGKICEFEMNKNATDLWKQEYPIEKYPDNNDELIVGNALVLSEAELES